MDVNHSKPAKPELSFGGNGLEVTFMPPDGAAHAVVYVYDADGKKSFLDAGTNNKILAPGETGRVLPVRGRHRQNVVVDDVGGAGEFSATVSYRSLNGFAWGPESPRSDTVILALPGRKGTMRKSTSAPTSAYKPFCRNTWSRWTPHWRTRPRRRTPGA